MYKLITILLFFVSVGLYAEGGFNFRMVEDSSYKLYLYQDWKGLQQFGRDAVHNGIDYFYLRQRIGIAAYKLEKYQVAKVHFEHADAFNHDDVTDEYLYYSLLFSGNYNEASRLTKRFSKDLKVKTKTGKNSIINLLQVEGGLKFTNSYLVNNLYYFSLGIGHTLGRGYTAYHSYTYTTQQYFYGTYQQHQYYLSADLPLKKGFSLQPAFSLFYARFQIQIPEVPAKSKLAFLGSLNISKVAPYVAFNLTNSFTNFDTSYQIQHALALTVYPLANQKFWFGGNVILFTSNFYKNLTPLTQGNIGFNVPRYFSFNVVYTHAGVHNFNLYNGYLAQNGYDLLKDNLTITPAFIIKYRYIIYAAYQLEFKREEVTRVNYTSNAISLGLKIKL